MTSVRSIIMEKNISQADDEIGMLVYRYIVTCIIIAIIYVQNPVCDNINNARIDPPRRPSPPPRSVKGFEIRADADDDDDDDDCSMCIIHRDSRVVESGFFVFLHSDDGRGSRGGPCSVRGRVSIGTPAPPPTLNRGSRERDADR